MSTAPDSPQHTSTATTLPDFDDLCSLLIPLGALLSPSELHGMLCGKLCGGARLDQQQWMALVTDFMDLAEDIPADSANSLAQLYTVSLAQLQDHNFSFALLLPTDDSELSIRAEALGQWCHGFLSGFGSSGLDAESNLSADIADSLRDLAAITQVDLDTDGSDEENEVSLVDISEYVRLAALNIFMECGLSASAAEITDPNSTDSANTLH